MTEIQLAGTLSEGTQETRVKRILTGLICGFCTVHEVEIIDSKGQRVISAMIVNPEKFPDLAAEGWIELLAEDIEYLTKNNLITLHAYN